MDTLTRMRAFIDVVDAEGFSAAARKIGRSKALLSKYVRELEDEVGALLLNRTTRQFSLTEAGHAYYGRALEIIRDIDSLRDSVRDASGEISGRVRLTAPRSYADAVVGDSLIAFAKAFPDVRLDVHLDDRFVDLVEEGFDLAIRIARLEDSSMIARRLGDFTLAVCASPEAIERFGRPERPEDLSRMPCISDTNGRWRNNWPFFGPNEEMVSVAVSGPLEVNSPVVARKALLEHLGFGMLPKFSVRDDLATGRLVPVLDDFLARDGGIYAVYPHRRYLPARVRALVDFLADWHKKNGASD
ncbi:LysR family transcriptional regulator [Notoacmeibacter sp. MSK16QG-6]|uniref:LysR family transcriptional regulator n=1 Tax=Notoacmeibacter sp. MSK16QG-6 TaxID=2957982 RepID=UPI0020A22870|nr:LysR family transcriptional regulator [Notoacmeibacter sp. MSK16QG-6]MCP1200389.1 LysR family transcriptional regulator [Notoacmeibacter sp. MSK16QG-6]